MYAQQGAVCQNCMEPLVPAQNGYGNDAQWGNQPQYGNGAQWGNQPQYGNDAQWGNQPQYGNDAQWGNQPQYGNDAQWGNQPQYGNDAQWGNQPQYGNDAQWGNQPQYGNDAQWGNQPQYNAGTPAEQVNMKTVGLDIDDIEHFTGGGAPSAPPKYEGSERTVALDLSDVDTSSADANDWGNSGGEWNESNRGGAATVALDAPDFSNLPTPSSPSPQAAAAGQIIIGQALPNKGNDQMTHQIDLRDVEKMYGTKSGNPIVMFYRSLPKLAFIISGALIGLALIGIIVTAIIVNQPEKVEHEITSDGEIVVKGTPAKPLTFKEIAAQTKANIPNSIPLSTDDIKEGILIGVSESAGILYNNNKVMSLDEFKDSDAFNQKLYTYAHADRDTPSQIPIILLVDGSLPMSTIYRLMYTLGPTRRQILIGGSTSTGVSAVSIEPLDWPDHETYIYSYEMAPNTQLKITRSDLVLRRSNDKGEPLMLNEANEPIFELRDEFLGGKVIYTNIQPALSGLKSAKQQSIRITTDGNVKVEQFINIVLHIQGDRENPNVQKLLLDTVPLH
ncbi:MAG: hypothetical protein IIY06_11580 [Proteobacteria bacterium]|nr:hypothetical protein [Pseudomonadota bacterium]